MENAFIFDMDGVLTDNMRDHAHSWVEVFRDFGLEGLDARRYMVEAAGMKGLDVLRHFLDPDIGPEEAERLSELKDFLYRVKTRSTIRPLGGLERFLLEAQESGIKLGIGTGAIPRNVTHVLDLLRLEVPFGAIVTAFDVPHGKPEPDIFLRAAELLGVEPARCIVFEDAVAGLEAAAKAGMAAVAVTTTNSADEFAGFDNVIEIIDDFSSLDPNKLTAHLSTRRIPTSS